MEYQMNEMTSEHYTKHINQDYVKHIKSVFLNLTQHKIEDRHIEKRPMGNGKELFYYSGCQVYCISCFFF